MQDGFIKVAAGTPEIRVADCAYNAQACLSLLHQAAAEGVKVLCLPELCLTGYTCGDLFLQDTLLQGAEDALRSLLEGSKDLDLLAVVGVPVRYNQKLFNCAAVFCRGGCWAWSRRSIYPIIRSFTRGAGSPPAGNCGGRTSASPLRDRRAWSFLRACSFAASTSRC